MTGMKQIVTPNLEQNQNLINLYDQTILGLCTKAREEHTHEPFVVEFFDFIDEQKIWETKVHSVAGKFEWNRAYPHFAGHLIVVNLKNGPVCLTRKIDTKHLKVMGSRIGGDAKQRAQ